MELGVLYCESNTKKALCRRDSFKENVILPSYLWIKVLRLSNLIERLQLDLLFDLSFANTSTSIPIEANLVHVAYDTLLATAGVFFPRLYFKSYEPMSWCYIVPFNARSNSSPYRNG